MAAAVIKADGYGLGATELAKTLMSAGCRDFFVARIPEAVELRKALDAEKANSAGQVAIFVLDGTLHGADPLLLVEHNVTPVLNSLEQVKTWNDTARQVGRTLPAFLQFDTGMHRAGMHDKDLEKMLSAQDELLQGLLNKRDENPLSHVDVQCVMTHLACADDAETVPGAAADAPRRAGAASRQQLERFNEIAKHFPGALKSPGASSTVLLEPEFHGDMVRMGGTFHGQAPFADMNPYENVLSLTSTVGQTRVVPPGGGIGYGHTYVADQPTTIATLPVGYADGMPRVPAGNPGAGPDNRQHVLFDGQPSQLAGKVSMDMTTVDITHVDPALHAPGTPVTLMGNNLTPDQFGAMYGTNPSETLTKLTSRVPRQYIESKEPDVEVGPSRFAWGGAMRPAATEDTSLRRQAIHHARDARLTKEASGAVATIDLGAVRRNIRAGLARLPQGTEPGVVLKADGYGMGAVKLAKVLVEEGCKDLFVARLSEAIDLRAGLRKEMPDMADKVAVLILDGILPGADTDTMVKLRLTPVLNSLDQVKDWNAAGRRHNVVLPAFLQVDSGMHRAGMHADDVHALVADRPTHLSHIKLQTIMTHLAKADDAVDEQRPDRSRNAGELSRQQLAAFEAIAANFPGVKKSPGASTTLFLEPEFKGDMVRMGATFHGQAPFDADTNPFEPILTLTSKVAQDRVVPPGGAIGYGHTFTAPEAMPVVTIPIGYADGMPRIPAGNRPGDAPTAAKVIIGGVPVPLAGKVSMDMTTVDARNVPEASRSAGTPVTIIGEGITPDHFGAMYGTNPSEVETKLSRRVFREYVDSAPPERRNMQPSSNVWGPLESRPGASAAQ